MVGVIIVAYKNPDRTADFINKQLPNLVNPHVIVVVNNASTIQECENLARSCNGIVCQPDDVVGKNPVYIINSSENLGFAKGNNLGVRFLSRNYPCRHILFSNDDIIIKANTDLQPMLDIIDNNDCIGAIGPDIIGLDGHHQSPHLRRITPYRQIGWMLFSNLRQKNNTTSNKNMPPAKEGTCYWVSGAFFLMRYDIFSAINGFDSDTFLYCEEPILAEKLKPIGKEMYFYPKIQVVHIEGDTTKNCLGNARIKRNLVESNCIYYKKYLKSPSIIIWIYKRLILSKL